MLWWNKKKNNSPEPLPAPAAALFNGYFGTDVDIGMNNVIDRELSEKILGRSIKRTAKDFTVVAYDETGAERGFAMDEFPSMTFPKNQSDMEDFGLPASQINWYANQSFIGYQVAAIIAQHWLVDKCCTMPARDAARHGFETVRVDGEDMNPKINNFIQRRDKAFGLKSNQVELIRFGRMFGIRIAKFEVDSNDPLYYEKPFNIDGVTPGSYKGISQIDPYWIVPLLDAQAAANPASKHFYEPTWWLINGKRIHRTHLCVMKNGDDVADILKPAYYYGGVSIPQKICDRVFAAERTANEAPMLAMTKRLITLKTDTTQAMANLPEFVQKILQWSALASNYGVKVLGLDEEADFKDTSLTDLDAVIMTQYQLVAAAAEVPATKLMGTSPKGFGAAGDYEIESYHELLESIQEHDLTPLVNRHHQLLIKSEVCPKFKCEYFETDITWHPVDTPTAKEAAEIEASKASRDKSLVEAGAIDGLDVRNRIRKDRDSDYTDIDEMVPGGPGDREAEQEKENELHDATVSPAEKPGEGDTK